MQEPYDHVSKGLAQAFLLYRKLLRNLLYSKKALRANDAALARAIKEHCKAVSEGLRLWNIRKASFMRLLKLTQVLLLFYKKAVVNFT